MKKSHYALRIATAFALTAIPLTAKVAKPAIYYVEPNRGNDANAGTGSNQPWRSFAKLNTLELAPGDQVMIAPGVHTETLKPQARGTEQQPVVIRFLPGTHEFAVEKAHRRPLFVSNACDAPTEPKPIGIVVENSRHLRVQGGGIDGAGKPLILMGGRMVEVLNTNAENIAYSNLIFDLKRPTVSEFRVMDSAPGWSIIQIAEGSTHSFKDGKFAWTGDIGSGAVMAQQAVPAQGRCWRMGFGWNPFDFATSVEDLGSGKFKLNFKDGYRLQTGDQFHFRHITRDSVGVHNARSKNIAFESCNFYALTGMGFVSQFTQNITLRRIRVAPPKGTLRTCPAWGDIFQFSNCRGDILVEDCVESGMQDDAINCHGTHLRIVDKPAKNQLRLRYMQPQTYGFAPYVAGDEIAVIDHQKLRELPGNPRRKVTECRPASEDGKEWLVILDGPAPAFNKDNVVDNITWHPNLTARNNRIEMNPVRGFLLTTRGKVVVEGNTFHRCAMPGILIEDDARGWYESTCVRNMVIRNNTFIGCGIEINPQTISNDPAEPVHENIRIENNFFDGAGISAKSVKGLTVTGNRTPGGALPVSAHPSCSEVTVKDNATKSKE
ncbi:MAG TPA: right-handed parallel beta-helix repeat-containing protein [Luteolibacter sp.]